MKTKKLKIEDFKTDKIPTKQQKKVRGGDNPVDGKDPIRGTGNTGGNG